MYFGMIWDSTPEFDQSSPRRIAEGSNNNKNARYFMESLVHVPRPAHAMQHVIDMDFLNKSSA